MYATASPARAAARPIRSTRASRATLLRPARAGATTARRCGAHVDARAHRAPGPRTLWRYADLLPGAPAHGAGLPVGCTPLLPGAAARRRARPARALREGRGREPDPLLQGPRRRGRLGQGRRARPEALACASTGNLAGAVAAHAARAGLAAVRLHPGGPERGKVVAAGVTARRRRGRWLLRRRQPPLHARWRPSSWAFVNVNLRPYYAEGSQDPRVEAAEQLGWRAGPGRRADRLPARCFTKIWKGFTELTRPA